MFYHRYPDESESLRGPPGIPSYNLTFSMANLTASSSESSKRLLPNIELPPIKVGRVNKETFVQLEISFPTVYDTSNFDKKLF